MSNEAASAALAPMDSWALWQLIDSAFPSGGFAHSGGLEAAVQAGLLNSAPSLQGWLEWALSGIMAQSCGYINAACAHPEDVLVLDAHADTTQLNHVARKASMAQGKALVAAAAAAWPDRFRALKTETRRAEASCHQSVIVGVLAGRLGFSSEIARKLFLWQNARDMMSAAVRLNIIGPMAAQKLLATLEQRVQPLVQAHADDGLDDIATVSPLLDVVHAHHDTLYSRLFQT